jgi:hypothetical protein
MGNNVHEVSVARQRGEAGLRNFYEMRGRTFVLYTAFQLNTSIDVVMMFAKANAGVRCVGLYGPLMYSK